MPEDCQQCGQHAQRGQHRDQTGRCHTATSTRCSSPNPLTSELVQSRPDETGRTHVAGRRFGALFAEVFVALWQAGIIAPPDLSRVDPELLRMLEVGDKEPLELPPGLRYLYVRAWSRLYGMVGLEAFGHLHCAMTDTVTLFESTLDDCAAEIGFVHLRRGAS